MNNISQAHVSLAGRVQRPGRVSDMPCSIREVDSLLMYKLKDVVSWGVSATLMVQCPSCFSPRPGVLREGIERGAIPFFMLAGTSLLTVTASSSKNGPSATLVRWERVLPLTW